MPSLARLFALVATITFILCMMMPGCGRSSLDTVSLGNAIATCETCSTGCCGADGACRAGTDGRACGSAGAACVTCAPGQSCVPVLSGGGECRDEEPACGPNNCAGCCVGDLCMPGVTSRACGVGGAACANCSSGSICDVNAGACIDESLCPRSYDACPDDVTTPVTPKAQGVCTAVDLDALQSGCADGPNAATCTAALEALAATNAACETCVDPFNVAFADARGLILCAAPFVPRACNRSSGCATDCANASCAACPDGDQKNACLNQAAGGPCATFITQAACVASALLPGQLCSPLTYGLNFGRWLGAVSAYYCGE